MNCDIYIWLKLIALYPKKCRYLKQTGSAIHMILRVLGCSCSRCRPREAGTRSNQGSDSDGVEKEFEDILNSGNVEDRHN